MKKVFKSAMLIAMACLMTGTVSSCSDDNNDGDTTTLSEGDQYLQKVLAADVDNTINPTYKLLADSCELLYQQLSAMNPGSITQEQVNEACTTFLHARANYEKSEAYLLGAAAHFLIDPHIDSWPLGLKELHTYLQGDVSVSIDDQSMLGFHGIEFILFRDGKPRNAEELNTYDTYNKNGLDFTVFSGAKELAYAKTVALDLRNSVYRLECSWNENAGKERFEVLDNLGYTYVTDKGQSYGYNMRYAGDPVKSTYASVKLAASSLLGGDGGASGIADEVGNVKINNPYSGEDVNYIESPYSYNSLTDFQNNIHSIENIWYGGIAGNRSDVNFHNYFVKYDPATGARVETAINNAIAQIAKIPYPFVLNYKNAQCGNAIKACQELKDALDAAVQFIGSTNK
jgi:hypothetical protein